MSVPTLAKAGPLVRGVVTLSEVGEGARIELRVKLNLQRFLGPLLAASIVGTVVQLQLGEFSSLLWGLLLGGSLLTALVQAPFVGWAKQKLISALAEELHLTRQ